MPTSIIEELKLDTVEGRKAFYEKVTAHKEELKRCFNVEFPDYDTWEKECTEKMKLNGKAIERRKRFNEAKETYNAIKSDRIYSHLLQLDGEDADKNNRDMIDKMNNDRKGYVNSVAKKILTIDTKKEREKMQGKTSLELAQMYFDNPELYDLAWVVNDLLKDYPNELDKNLRKKIEERKLDLQSLAPVPSSVKSFENELYAFLPLPVIENEDQMKADSINFKEFGNEKISFDIYNFFVSGAVASLQTATNKCNEAYEKSVNEKIDDLLSACKSSEDASWKDSSKYKTMKKALDAFKKDWKNPKKKNEVKENLKKAAKDYLVYKANETMKENAQGKVAAADGILELIDEMDKHKMFDKDDIKPFIKPSKDENVYEQRATEVHNKAKAEYGKKKVAVSLEKLEEDEFGAKIDKKTLKSNEKKSQEKVK